MHKFVLKGNKLRVLFLNGFEIFVLWKLDLADSKCSKKWFSPWTKLKLLFFFSLTSRIKTGVTETGLQETIGVFI